LERFLAAAVALVRDNDEKATLSSPFASTSPITLDFPTATLTVFREKYTRITDRDGNGIATVHQKPMIQINLVSNDLE